MKIRQHHAKYNAIKQGEKINNMRACCMVMIFTMFLDMFV